MSGSTTMPSRTGEKGTPGRIRNAILPEEARDRILFSLAGRQTIRSRTVQAGEDRGPAREESLPARKGFPGPAKGQAGEDRGSAGYRYAGRDPLPHPGFPAPRDFL
jgi:hypothetical protein